MSDLPAFLRDRPPRPRRGELPTPAAPVAADGSPSRRVPGEPGLWVLLLGDMTIFALFFGVFLLGRADDPAAFAAGREQLTVGIGAANTIVLLTSSLLVALAARAHREDRGRDAGRLLLGALACALLFAVLKSVEWVERLHAGDTPASADFFMFYFVLTGVHFLHLVLGVVALVVVRRRVRRPTADPDRDRLVVEVGTSYWHVVDLLWIVIFPLLYLAST